MKKLWTPFLKCNLFYTKITPLYSNCIRYFPSALFKPLNGELNPIRHLLALVRARHIVHVSRLRVKKAFKVRIRAASRQLGISDLYNQDPSNQIHLDQVQTVWHVTRGQYGPVSTTCYDLRPETSPLLLFNGGQDCGAKEYGSFGDSDVTGGWERQLRSNSWKKHSVSENPSEHSAYRSSSHNADLWGFNYTRLKKI